MRLIGTDEQQVISSVRVMTLDELFELAGNFGELETGGFRGGNVAQIKLRNTGEDFIIVKSQNFQTLKENIQECISRSRSIINFYNTL